MPKHGACCLASLNLSEFIINPYTDDAHIDVESFNKAVHIGVRTLDRLIDENYYRHPLKEQQELSYNYRNIGLGLFGYATALMKLGIRYGSKEAIKFTDDLFRLMFRQAVFESANLAKELGAFPKYKECIFDSDIIKNHFSPEEINQFKFREYGIRNCSLISIAPNGSLATMLGESGGCEPEFALKFTRRTVGMTDGEDHYYDVYCKSAKEYMELNNTKILPDYFVGTADIKWDERVRTQAAMQNHVDTAISSTVNLPESATKEDVAGLYLLAWELGCKGITIFRDGCKRLGILTTDNKHNEATEESNELKRGEVINVVNDVVGLKRKLTTGCGSLHCTAFFDRDTGELMETYLSKGSTGGCNNFMIGLSRMISLSARAGVSVDDIIDQLNSCGACPSYAVRSATKHDTSKGSCCPVAIGNALKSMYKEMQDTVHVKKTNTAMTTENAINETNICPECGDKIVMEGGCCICKSCGWSKCS